MCQTDVYCAYPDAKSWHDTRPPDPTKPCCRVAGPAYVEPAINAGLPVVLWRGDGWGIAYSEEDGTVFHALEADGRGAAAPVTVLGGYSTSSPALARGNGRFAIAGHEGWRQSRLGFEILTPLGFAPWSPTWFDVPDDISSVAVSRLTTARGWVVATHVNEESSSYVRTYFADDEGNIDDHQGKIVANGAVTHAVLANMKSRIVLGWGDASGIYSGSFAWPPDGDAFLATQMLPFPGLDDTRIALVPFRDNVVVAVVSSPDVYSSVFDPWERAVVNGPTRVGRSDLFDYGAALAAAEDRGFVGLCYSRGTQGHQSVVFRVLGPDGSPWTAEQTVAEDLELAAKCDVAWSGEEFLVAWWSAGMQNNTITVVRLAPTF